MSEQEKPLFFVHYETNTKTYQLFDVGYDEVIDFLHRGKSMGKSMHNGKTYSFAGLINIKVFKYGPKFHASGFVQAMAKGGQIDSFGNVKLEALQGTLSDITGGFIDSDFWVQGTSRSQIPERNSNAKKEIYISEERLKQLKELKHGNYDLKKLIRLLEELNEVYGANLVLSTGMLIRAIMDHIPPLLGFTNFQSIVAQYKSTGNAKSFTSQMKILEEFKDAADSALHSQIRRRETLPEMIQFQKQTAVDFLLQEIVRKTEEDNHPAP
jgi:hypothetical protein